jgi:predicted RNA binding protein YcfA (HicA-like mRNA interferase family)
VPKIPGVSDRHAVRALEKAGFRIVREGKHIVMSDGRGMLTIPGHNPVNAFTMGGIAGDAGLTVEEFKRLRCWPSNNGMQLTTAARCAPSPSAHGGSR